MKKQIKKIIIHFCYQFYLEPRKHRLATICWFWNIGVMFVISKETQNRQFVHSTPDCSKFIFAVTTMRLQVCHGPNVTLALPNTYTSNDVLVALCKLNKPSDVVYLLHHLYLLAAITCLDSVKWTSIVLVYLQDTSGFDRINSRASDSWGFRYISFCKGRFPWSRAARVTPEKKKNEKLL